MARSSHLQRQLDRFLGIPAIFLVGLTNRRRSVPRSPRRIGLIQPSAIGDMVLISGLLLHLQRCYPGAELHVFHGPHNGAAVRLLPVDVVAHQCSFTQPLATLRLLRQANLDVLINSAPWTRLTALLTAMSGARTTVGFRSPGQYIDSAFDIAIPYQNNRHEVDNHRAVAETFGPMSEYRLHVRRTVNRVPEDLPYDQLILMHVSPGGSAAKQKSWPARYWRELAGRLIANGWIIGFTGIKADRQAVEAVMGTDSLPQDRCISFVGRLSLAELCEVLVRARLLVTVDTGIAHLAAALDVPVVGLHGPSRFERWGCTNKSAIGVNAPHPAAGYINYGFEQHPLGDEIMPTLSVDMAAEAVERALQQPVSRPAIVPGLQAAE